MQCTGTPGGMIVCSNAGTPGAIIVLTMAGSSDSTQHYSKQLIMIIGI